MLVHSTSIQVCVLHGDRKLSVNGSNFIQVFSLTLMKIDPED